MNLGLALLVAYLLAMLWLSLQKRRGREPPRHWRPHVKRLRDTRKAVPRCDHDP